MRVRSPDGIASTTTPTDWARKTNVSVIDKLGRVLEGWSVQRNTRIWNSAMAHCDAWPNGEDS